MTTPRPSLSNFAALEPDLIVRSFLYGAARAPFPETELCSRLDWLLSEDDCAASLSALAACGELQTQGGLTLTRKGVFAARAVLGREAQGRWKHIRSRLLPLIPLRLVPSDPLTQRRFVRAESFRAAIIRIGYGLQCSPSADLKSVCGELVWVTLEGARIARAKEPFTVFGPTERAILASVAKPDGPLFYDTVDALCAAALGLNTPSSISALRDRLIQIGLDQHRTAGGAAPKKR